MIEKLLDLAIGKKASDLHLSVGRAPVLRVAGRLRNVDVPALTPNDTEAYVKEVTPERNMKEWEEICSTDFCFPHRDISRFRVSAFKQQGVYGLVMRLLPAGFLTFEQIGIPEQVKKVITGERGLFLVTGPTGSGKTTTLATLLNYLNEKTDYHIITIEDPIEFRHRHKKGIITQREVGQDVPSFAEGLKRAFRQDPDVVMVGEMRDLETTRVAITAAETGHLVFATLHTSGAVSTIVRLISQFPHEEQPRIRAQISASLLGLISQTLVPSADGKNRYAVMEVLFTTPPVANLIREGKEARIPDEILKGRQMGMITLDEFLYNLYISGSIRGEDAIDRAMNPQDLEAKIRGGAQR
jgi:twitching motility protein PilT